MRSLRPACGRRSDARIRGFVVQSADQFYPVLACADALQGVSFVIAVLTGIAEPPTSAGQPDPIVLTRQCVDTMAPLRCARVRSGPAGHRGAWLICSGFHFLLSASCARHVTTGPGTAIVRAARGCRTGTLFRGQLTDRSSRALTISADSAIHIHLPEDLKQSLTASAPGISAWPSESALENLTNFTRFPSRARGR